MRRGVQGGALRERAVARIDSRRPPQRLPTCRSCRPRQTASEAVTWDALLRSRPVPSCRTHPWARSTKRPAVQREGTVGGPRRRGPRGGRRRPPPDGPSSAATAASSRALPRSAGSCDRMSAPARRLHAGTRAGMRDVYVALEPPFPAPFGASDQVSTKAGWLQAPTAYRTAKSVRCRPSSDAGSPSWSERWAGRPTSWRSRESSCGTGSETARRPVPRARCRRLSAGGRGAGRPDQPPGATGMNIQFSTGSSTRTWRRP